MVTDIFAGGGKALKSNLIERRLDFIRTFAEHLDEIGIRKVISKKLEGTTSETAGIYITPKNKTAYLTFMCLAGCNTGLDAIKGVQIELDNVFNWLLRLELSNTQKAPMRVATSLTNPMKLSYPESLTLRKRTADTGFWASASIVVYELDKRIS